MCTSNYAKRKALGLEGNLVALSWRTFSCTRLMYQEKRKKVKTNLPRPEPGWGPARVEYGPDRCIASPMNNYILLVIRIIVYRIQQ